MKDILLTKEVAEKLRISEYYVRELVRKGQIKAYKEGGRGGFRIPVDEVNKYIQVKKESFQYKPYLPVEVTAILQQLYTQVVSLI